MDDRHSITAQNLYAQYPRVLADAENTAALGKAAAEKLAKRSREINEILIYARIDKLPEELLDILARDFKVDWWDPDYSIEEKRRTLKDSWRVHKILGTKAAVETAISAIYPGTKVREWFEYGGKPFYFRLSIDGAKVQPDSEKHKKVLERVNYYKSLRSHLDGFIWNFRGEPFVNDPDKFTLRRFIQSVAFSNQRNFPPVRLDGSRLLDGSWLLNAVQRSMFGFPCISFHAAAKGLRDTLERAGISFAAALAGTAGHVRLPELRARFPTSGIRMGFSTPRVSFRGMEQNRQSLSRAALTVDSMWRLDGSVPLDGSRKLNADITKEDL